MTETVHSRLAEIRARVAAACAAHGRAADVTLIAVSKFQPLEAVNRLIAEGQREFGENRAQEVVDKWERSGAADGDVTVHFLGSLQRNKVAAVVRTCAAVHSLDSARLAAALSAAGAKHGRTVTCFVQVNIGDEPQKSGVAIPDLPALLDECARQPFVDVVGLMCIPPAGEPAEPYFDRLRGLADRHGLRRLSMGMSADFEAAIGCGATHVRVGTALFGPRPTA